MRLRPFTWGALATVLAVPVTIGAALLVGRSAAVLVFLATVPIPAFGLWWSSRTLWRQRARAWAEPEGRFAGSVVIGVLASLLLAFELPREPFGVVPRQGWQETVDMGLLFLAWAAGTLGALPGLERRNPRLADAAEGYFVVAAAGWLFSMSGFSPNTPVLLSIGLAAVVPLACVAILAFALRRPRAWQECGVLVLIPAILLLYDGWEASPLGRDLLGTLTAGAAATILILRSPWSAGHAGREPVRDEAGAAAPVTGRTLATYAGAVAAGVLGTGLAVAAQAVGNGSDSWRAAGVAAVAGIATMVAGLRAHRPVVGQAVAVAGATLVCSAGYLAPEAALWLGLPGFVLPWVALGRALRPEARLMLVPLQYVGMIPFVGAFMAPVPTDLLLWLGTLHACLVWLALPVSGLPRRVLAAAAGLTGLGILVAAAVALLTEPTPGRWRLAAVACAFVVVCALALSPLGRRARLPEPTWGRAAPA